LFSAVCRKEWIRLINKVKARVFNLISLKNNVFFKEKRKPEKRVRDG
jgi:hypothetical protein